MEKAMINWEQEILINELNQGRELAKQLQNHLDPLASPESCDSLVQQILSSYEKAISMLNREDLVEELDILETPQSIDCISPKSEVFGRDYRKNVNKKRKKSTELTQRVRVCSGSGPSSLVDDGYKWRKYGQKDILGAKFPRAYYRCTHRHSQGCLATKLVQRSEEDPSTWEITYQGTHACIQTAQHVTSLFASTGPTQNMGLPHQGEENQSQSHEILKVQTEEKFPSLSFPFTPTGSETGVAETNIFWENLKENSFPESVPPAFLMPELSDFDYLSIPAFQMDGENVGPSESDLTSVSNSPVAGLGFSLDQMDPNFAFDASELFC